jgi:hypothetical protein
MEILPQDFFTLDFLATYTGLVVAVYLVVTFTKSMVKQRYADAWVRLYAWLWALAIQVFVLYVKGDLATATLGLAVLNAFLVAIAAAGTHDWVSDPKAKTQKYMPPNYRG